MKSRAFKEEVLAVLKVFVMLTSFKAFGLVVRLMLVFLAR